MPPSDDDARKVVALTMVLEMLGKTGAAKLSEALFMLMMAQLGDIPADVVEQATYRIESNRGDGFTGPVALIREHAATIRKERAWAEQDRYEADMLRLPGRMRDESPGAVAAARAGFMEALAAMCAASSTRQRSTPTVNAALSDAETKRRADRYRRLRAAEAELAARRSARPAASPQARDGDHPARPVKAPMGAGKAGS